MDDETRAALAETREEVRVGFAEMRAESRAAFARIDRYFELTHVQHIETRDELRQVHADLGQVQADLGQVQADLGQVRTEVAQVRTDLAQLWAELRSFREWATAQIGELRVNLRQLAHRFEALGR